MKILMSLSATGTLYHFTNVRAAISALETKLLLSPVAMTKSDSIVKSALYFLSMTRSRFGRYHRNYSGGILFELDGNKINTRYKVKPVDYWQFFSSPKLRFDSDEQEERLVCDKPAIDVRPYLKSISLLIDNRKIDKMTLRLFNMHARKIGVPFYVYSDPQLFKLGRDKGRLSIEEAVDKHAPAPKYGDSGRGLETILSSALHVLRLTADPEFDTYDAIYDVKGIDKRFLGYLRYAEDLERQLSAAFQNASRAAGSRMIKDRMRLDRLLLEMKKFGLRTAHDYAEYIINRREADRQKISAKRAAENPNTDW